MAYTGQDNAADPVVREIVRRQGGTAPDDLAAYGRVAGAAGGAAACTALGVTAAAAPLCAYLGGTLGEIIGKAVPIARGAGMAELVADTWNIERAPRVRRAIQDQLAARTYMVLRDTAITEAARLMPSMPLDAGRAWADQWLTEHGAFIPDRWRPGFGDRSKAQQQYDFYEKLVAIAERRRSVRGESEELGIARDMGLLPAYFASYGPALPPDSPFSWDSIGLSEALERQKCRGQICIRIDSPEQLTDHLKSVEQSLFDAARAREGSTLKPMGGLRLIVQPSAAPARAALQEQALRGHRVIVPPAEQSWGKAVVVVGGAGAAALALAFLL